MDMSVQQDGGHDEGVLSRSELELELAALALAVSRSAQQRSRRPRAREQLLAETVDGFLAASLRLLSRTRRAHRGWMVTRLAEIASAGRLGLIGFEDWLAAQEPHGRRTFDRLPALRSGSAPSIEASSR